MVQCLDIVQIQMTNLVLSDCINNIYKGSKNDLSADSRGYNTINWDNQFKLIQREFPKVKFIKVGTELTYEELKNNIR